MSGPFYRVINTDGEVFEDTVVAENVAAVVRDLVTRLGERDLDREFEVDLDGPGEKVNGLWVPAIVGQWEFSIQPLRLEAGRYTGPCEDSYPDEWVADGKPMTGVVVVEVDTES